MFMLQQECLNLNDTCVSWSSPKTDQDTNILNLENEVYKYRTILEKVLGRTIAPEENYLPTLKLIVTLTLTVTGGIFPRGQLSEYH